jgi:type II secretory pathway pseudopilin PulG
VYSRKSETGFSMIEAIVVCAIIAIVSAIAVIQIGPTIRNARVDAAASYALNLVRHTRERAIDERRKYQITFVGSTTKPYATMNVFQGNEVATVSGITLQFTADSLTPTLSLPSDMRFLAPNPKPPAAPDGQVCGQSLAIDFTVTGGACGTSTTLTFNPDGSITSGLGGYADGVIYLGRTGDSQATRAISFFGATGRVRGWRMVKNGPSTWAWSTQ